MKRITDKERIDWLQRIAGDRDRGLVWRSRFFKKFVAYDGKQEFRGNTVRQAIDAAIRSQGSGRNK